MSTGRKVKSNTPAVAAQSSVSMAQAKAGFSALVTGVEQKHKPVTILRRGKPVAQIVPLPGAAKPSLRGSMAGTARVLGDIVSPWLEEWTTDGW